MRPMAMIRMIQRLGRPKDEAAITNTVPAKLDNANGFVSFSKTSP